MNGQRTAAASTELRPVAPAINIFSGAPTELGAALTNPTALAREKGALRKAYPVLFAGTQFPDAESAYHFHKDHFEDREALVAEIVSVKLQQHDDLLKAIEIRGGAAWLRTCSHLTNARSPGSQAWEGVGVESRFIRALAAGYEKASAGQSAYGQAALF